LIEDKFRNKYELDGTEDLFCRGVVPISVSSLSNKFMARFKDKYTNFSLTGIKSDEVYRWCRDSYCGGITNVYWLSVKRDVCGLDFSSSYPDEMAKDILPIAYETSIGLRTE